MSSLGRAPKPGETVVLKKIPAGLLDGLPAEDQQAIREIVGKPVSLNEYDEHGRAELEFWDTEGVTHFIWVTPNVIKATKQEHLQATAKEIAAQIRQALRRGGASEHAIGVQRFFKDEIKSHGWYTADLRRATRGFRREILSRHDFDFLVGVADDLFRETVVEEKVAAVFLLEKMDSQFGEREFRLFESWLDRISSWADHDALVHNLIAPMVAANPAWVKAVLRWAKSCDHWHRRAACVALIRGTRKKEFFPEIKKLSDALLADEDDMVQKGLGWLLRETTKFDAKRTVPYLMKIRERAPRLVLRTACETLPVTVKTRILAPGKSQK
jgi:3-methyladenine DNA glycosylase AlkD